MYRFFLALACSALVAPTAFAAGKIDVSGLIKPGMWETTIQMSMKGMGAMPEQTRQHCVTQADVDNFADKMGDRMKKSNGQVQIKDMTLKDKTLHFVASTTKGDMTVDIVFDDPTHYHETMTGTIAGMDVSMQGKAHRVGDCPKTPDSGS